MFEAIQKALNELYSKYNYPTKSEIESAIYEAINSKKSE